MNAAEEITKVLKGLGAFQPAALDTLLAVVADAVAAERERCAKIADSMDSVQNIGKAINACKAVAAGIRNSDCPRRGNGANDLMKKPKKPTPIKPCKAWALIDPQDRQILPHRIYDERVSNGGRGSVTNGWKCIRVEVRASR